MISHAARGDGGNVALGMAPLAARTLLAPLMIDTIDNPGFRATVTIGTPKKLLPMLLDESLHICVCTGREISSSPLFVSVPLAQFPLAIVVRADHPLTRSRNLMPADLERYPLLRTRSLELSDDDDHGSVLEGLQKAPSLTIEDYDVLMKITSGSDAVWLTSPISAHEGIANGTLAAIPISWLPEEPFAQMTAYYLKKRTLSLTARKVLDNLVMLSEEIFGSKPIGN
nr:LysR family transcriptional regulator substrate-binding protein [Novosphingobium sp. G106]